VKDRTNFYDVTVVTGKDPQTAPGAATHLDSGNAKAKHRLKQAVEKQGVAHVEIGQHICRYLICFQGNSNFKNKTLVIF
jgi:hypothetical protein